MTQPRILASAILSVILFASCNLLQSPRASDGLYGTVSWSTSTTLKLSQSLEFVGDDLKVCATLEPRIASNQSVLLRYPLGFQANGQLQISLTEEGPLPLPNGRAPDADNLLTYDFLGANSSRGVCAQLASNQLPVDVFWIRTVFQPWTNAGDQIPITLALLPGAVLPDLKHQGLVTLPCRVSKNPMTIACRSGKLIVN